MCDGVDFRSSVTGFPGSAMIFMGICRAEVNRYGGSPVSISYSTRRPTK